MMPDIHRVSYKGLIADVRQNDLDDALKLLRDMDAEERAQFMKSVHGALDKVLNVVERKQKISPKTLQDACNDIGIWLANEMVEGRSDQYKVAVQ